MTLRILVADDEAPARRRLVRMLGAMADVAVVGEAADGRDAAERIGTLAPDLVLLDIRMPIMDGFEVVAAVGVERMPATVFVTAYDEHALQAFEVRALDYLLKPVAPARLREAIDRARTRLTAPPDPAPLRSLVAATAGAYLRRILVHDDRGAHLLPVDAVTLARAERNYVVLHTARGRFRVRGTVGTLAERLDPATFLRVNRSDVVRLDAIRELQPWSHGDYRIVLGDGSALLWSRRYRAQTAGVFELG